MAKVTTTVPGGIYLRGRTWWHYFSVNGKQKSESLKTKDRREAEALHQGGGAPNAGPQRRAVTEPEAGAEGPGLGVSESWDKYVLDKSRPASAEITVKDYGQRWAKFAGWWAGNHGAGRPFLAEVTEQDAQDFAVWLDGQGLSPNRYSKIIGTCRLVFKVLRRFTVNSPNPFGSTAAEGIRNKPLHSEGHRPLTRAELQAVLKGATGELHTLLLIGACTGLRLGDAATLTWDEVNLRLNHISRRPLKTRRYNNRAVVIPIHKDLKTALVRAAKKSQTGFVLAGLAAMYDKEPAAVSRAVQKHLRGCGIETQAQGGGRRKVCRVGFHSLRHSFVTLCAEAGVPLPVVQALCGHNSTAIQQTYLHMGEDVTRKAIATLPRLMGQDAPDSGAADLPAGSDVLDAMKGKSQGEMIAALENALAILRKTS